MNHTQELIWLKYSKHFFNVVHSALTVVFCSLSSRIMQIAQLLLSESESKGCVQICSALPVLVQPTPVRPHRTHNFVLSAGFVSLFHLINSSSKTWLMFCVCFCHLTTSHFTTYLKPLIEEPAPQPLVLCFHTTPIYMFHINNITLSALTGSRSGSSLPQLEHWHRDKGCGPTMVPYLQ